MTPPQRYHTRPGLTASRVRALLGGLSWLAGVSVARPAPFDTTWGQALLLLAPLALLPIGLHLAAIASAVALPNRIWRVVTAVQLPAALFLGFAYLLPQGVPSASLSLPWLITTGLIAWCGLHRLWKRGLRPLDEVCLDFGLIFVVVGGAWVVSDRLGFRLLDFETVIVLLTAIHFHYAGFILPIVTGLAARQIGGLPAKLAGVGVISGVLSWPSVLQQLSSSWVR